MPWVQVFPTGPTLISQSVAQFQENWLFLQTTLDTDHFFNTGAPSVGHHRFVQMPSVATVAPALALDGVLYTDTVPATATNQPKWRNATGIYQIPIVTSGTVVTALPGRFTLVDLSGTPSSTGYISVSDGNTHIGCAFVQWINPVGTYCKDIIRNGNIAGLIPVVNAIQVVVTSPGTYNWNYLQFFV